jgi:hypothetical protein
MGIEISAYGKLQKIKTLEDGEDYYGGVSFYKNPHFPNRADDIEENTLYNYKEHGHFLSVSYSSYNRLRNQLAEITEHDCEFYWSGQEGPFSELINFSDCEGTIGTKISKKLLKDFKDYRPKANIINDQWFLNFYDNMLKAFKMASNNGAVSFD